MKIQNNNIDSYIKNIDKEKIAGALVFGPSDSVAMSRFNFIAKKIVADLQDQFLVVDITKERISNEKSAIIDEFYSISMFGGRKLIIIRDPQIQVNNAMKAFLAELKEVRDGDNFILILAGDLDRSNSLRKICENDPNFAALACYEDNDFVIKKLIEQQLKKGAGGFDLEVVRYLFEILPNNRQIIALEIDKILTYLDGQKATVENVSQIVYDQSEAKFDEFLDFFIKRDKKNAVLKLESLISDGFEPVMVVRFLTNYLIKIYNAKSEVERGVSVEVAVKNQHLFFKAETQFKTHLNKISFDDIKKILFELEGIEVLMKISLSRVSRGVLVNYVCG